MRNSRSYQTAMFGMLMSATGCGAIPDVIVDAAKDSARQAMQEVVDDVVNDVIDDTIGGWLEFPDLAFDDFAEFADEEQAATDDSTVDDSESPQEPEQDEDDVEDTNDSGGRR